jgi:Mrp family chromosome partitioning ATPase
MMAVNGSRTLLVDCDLRNIGLAKALDLPAGPGLIEALRGELPLESAVRGDVVEGLDLLTVSTPLFTSEDMFGGPEMARLIEQARGHYKAVILDLPPVLGVADARTLAVQADVSALIVRWGRTSPRAVSMAASALQSDGVNLVGLVLGMVDPSSEAAGGTYYSRGYHKYYQTA